MSPPDLAILTKPERQLLEEMRQVPTKTLWGWSIRASLKHITANGFRNLCDDLRSQSEDNFQAVEKILGESVHSKLMEL